MVWARMLAYITGTVDQELLLRNEYLAAENRIFKAQIKGRLLLSDGEKATLAEIAYRLGRKALREVAMVAQPETILAWYRRLNCRSGDFWPNTSIGCRIAMRNSAPRSGSGSKPMGARRLCCRPGVQT
jgi:hypothetical protein